MSTEALFGREVVVRYKPKSPGAPPLEEKLTVRELPLSRMPQYLRAAEDIAEMCALLMNRDRDWVDKITIESVEHIVEMGTEINSAFFGKWMDLQHRMQSSILSQMRGVEQSQTG